jgi:hypothetical protein
MELVLRAIKVTRLCAAPKYASSLHANIDLSSAEAALTSDVLNITINRAAR